LIRHREGQEHRGIAPLREYTFVNNSPMPSYKDKLSTQELSDLLSYLASLKGQAN